MLIVTIERVEWCELHRFMYIFLRPVSGGVVSFPVRRVDFEAEGKLVVSVVCPKIRPELQTARRRGPATIG